MAKWRVLKYIPGVLLHTTVPTIAGECVLNWLYVGRVHFAQHTALTVTHYIYPWAEVNEIVSVVLDRVGFILSTSTTLTLSVLVSSSVWIWKHMWLMGCPNPCKLKQSWEFTFLKVFTYTKTKGALKFFFTDLFKSYQLSNMANTAHLGCISCTA